MAEVRGGEKTREMLQGIGRRLTNATKVRVGFLAGATYPDGTSVAMVAAIQDFGAPAAGIPPRPFFRNMIAAKKGGWPDAIRVLLKDNDYDALRTLQQTGEAISGQLRQSIIDTNDPPLAESTLRSRGVPGMVYDPKDSKTFGAKPLVRTGHLLNSIEYEVKA